MACSLSSTSRAWSTGGLLLLICLIDLSAGMLPTDVDLLLALVFHHNPAARRRWPGSTRSEAPLARSNDRFAERHSLSCIFDPMRRRPSHRLPKAEARNGSQ